MSNYFEAGNLIGAYTANVPKVDTTTTTTEEATTTTYTTTTTTEDTTTTTTTEGTTNGCSTGYVGDNCEIGL